MAFRFIAFYKALEDMIEEMRGESGTIVFYPDLRVPFPLEQTDRDLRAFTGVPELIFKKIGQEAHNKPLIHHRLDRFAGDGDEGLAALTEGGRVKIHDSVDEVSQVAGLATKA